MNHILNQYLPFLIISPLFWLFWTIFGHFSYSTSINDSLAIELNYLLNQQRFLLNWTIFWMESWESLVVLFKFLGLLKKGRLKPSSSLLKLTFLDFSIHHFKNGGFEILNWPSWGSVDVWCLTGPAEEGLMGAEGINSRKNDLEHIHQIVCFKKSTQKSFTLKQSEKVLNFCDTQTDQRHFIIICIIIIKNGENLQRMHMRANVLISAQLSMAKSLSPYL